MANSNRCNQGGGMSNQYSNADNVENNSVDLTLKLGLPVPAFQQTPPLYRNNIQQGLVNQGTMNIEGQRNLNGKQYAWPPHQMGSSSMVYNMNHENHVFNHYSRPSMRYPSYNFASSTRPNHTALPPNGYTLLDVPPRRAAIYRRQRELGSSSASVQGRQGQHSQRVGAYNDPNRRCTNYNCKTNDTPMWRKGPLGPKTLCNACGIKYRKDKEKREKKAMEEEAVYRPIINF